MESLLCMLAFGTDRTQTMTSDNVLPNPVLVMVQPMAERLINQILQLDTEAVTRLESFAGKLVTVNILGFPEFFLFPEKGRLRLLWTSEHEPNATIHSVLPDVIRSISLLTNRSFRLGRHSDIVGDPDTVRLVISFFASFQPDWEEKFSGIVGDVLSRKASRLLQAVARWVEDGNRSMAQNVSEYLQQERAVLATRPRLERFLTEVQRIQQEIGQLEPRLQALDQQARKG